MINSIVGQIVKKQNEWLEKLFEDIFKNDLGFKGDIKNIEEVEQFIVEMNVDIKKDSRSLTAIDLYTNEVITKYVFEEEYIYEDFNVSAITKVRKIK